MRETVTRIFILGLVLIFAGALGAQEQIGGPYTVDDNTLLLLHFDGDLTNESQYSLDGVGHGSLSYITNSVSGLDQCIRIENDDVTDSCHVTIADTVYLDLTGDWTIEGWINIFTFGEGSSDWRWVPRLVMKTGDEVFWRPNYFVEMWGSTRFFSLGYQAVSQDAWPQVNTPDNTLVPGQWFHLTFIRDTGNQILLGIIHDGDRNLVNFNAVDYTTFNAADDTPITTDQPVFIGFAGGGGDSWLDGFVDEIRISDIVREVEVPPIVTNVTELPNQVSTVVSYDVDAKIYTLFSTTIQSASLYYDNGSGFTEVSMVAGVDDIYTGTIPGQTTGAIIDYYVKAEDNNGLTFTQPQNAETDNAYYTFGVYTPSTQTLSLSFEEGSGIPVDGSDYAHTVTSFGTPQYSTDAAVGTYSLFLEGDSSNLEVDSPFLASDSFCVDLWLKPDSVRDYCRIFNRPGSAGSWSTNNYQIRFNNAQQFQCISDGSFALTFDDFNVEIGNWYHIIFEVQNAPASDTVLYYGVAEIRDADDNLLGRRYAGFDQTVINAQAPLRIGKSTTGSYPPYFVGNFDEIMVYNYPEQKLPLEEVIVNSIGDLDGKIPMKYELSQNYPNPFNPTTEIKFVIPRNQDVNLVVYNVLGEKVITLVDGNMDAGENAVVWNGTNDMGRKVASGVFFYRLTTENFTKVRKMVLLK